MAIAGGASAALGVGNIINSGNVNRKNRNWQEKMYARQLADERENWSMQNEYNEQLYEKYSSPAAQVAQMRAAGINPDLQNISSASPASAGSVGSASVPSSGPFQPTDFVGAFANVIELLQSMRSNALDADIKSAELQKLGKSYALDYLAKSYNPRFSDLDSRNFVETVRQYAGGQKAFVKSLMGKGLSRRAANVASNYVFGDNSDVWFPDIQERYYQKFASAEDRRTHYMNTVGSSSWSSFDDIMQDTIKGMNIIADKITKLNLKSAQSNYSAASARNSYEKSYYDALQPYASFNAFVDSQGKAWNMKSAEYGAKSAAVDFNTKKSTYGVVVPMMKSLMKLDPIARYICFGLMSGNGGFGLGDLTSILKMIK